MKRGYYFTVGNRGYFLISDKKVRNDALAREMIQLIATYNHKVEQYLDLYLTNRELLEYIKLNMQRAVLEYKTTSCGYKYVSIYGEHFTCNYPIEDFQKDVRVG